MSFSALFSLFILGVAIKGWYQYLTPFLGFLCVLQFAGWVWWNRGHRCANIMAIQKVPPYVNYTLPSNDVVSVSVGGYGYSFKRTVECFFVRFQITNGDGIRIIGCILRCTVVFREFLVLYGCKTWCGKGCCRRVCSQSMRRNVLVVLSGYVRSMLCVIRGVIVCVFPLMKFLWMLILMTLNCFPKHLFSARVSRSF